MIAFAAALLLARPGVLHADSVPAPSRPNILWITAEDICPSLGCYGDPDAATPNLDRFAAEAVRYTRVYSVHPCCSPSRSCLATGVYPTRLGTFQHRGKMWVKSELVKCFPTLLRQAGYYTFNGMKGGAAKLDYNFDPQDQPWDKIGSKQVEWRNRPAGKPFFGQVNLFRTHQSQYGLRKVGQKDREPAPFVHEPAKVHLPPYLADGPAAREIWAEYHDRISEMDAQFAALLKQLADDGLAEDTIVFFFGDNGHGIPGGKVWLWDQGPHVPLVVRFPKKWQHWAGGAPGSVCDRLVSFLDFAPTVLSLAGVAVPETMQGGVFLGPKAGAPRQYVHAARDFHDSADFDTCRMVRDERFYYIRNFMPQQGWDAILYSWEQAPYLLDEWRRHAVAGKLKADTRQAAFFRSTKPAEELYDMASDPWQMRNLAADPQHRATLHRLRAECERWMADNGDLGLLSQYEIYARADRDSPYETALDIKRNPVKRLLEAANLANRREVSSIPTLRVLLQDEDAAIRRWGALGLLSLRTDAAVAADALRSALGDLAPDVRLIAAEALAGLGHGDAALPVLTSLLRHDSRIIRNETLLALCRIGPPARTVLPHLESALGPSRHNSLWSYDNIKPGIGLARSCLSEPPPSTGAELPPKSAHPAPADSNLRASRQKPLP